LQKLIIEGFIKVLLLKRLLMFSKKITILPTDVTLLPVGKFSLFLSISSLVALLIVTPALAADFAVISKTGTSGSTNLDQNSLTLTPCSPGGLSSTDYVAIGGSTFSADSGSRTGMTEVNGMDPYGNDPCGEGTPPPPPYKPILDGIQKVLSLPPGSGKLYTNPDGTEYWGADPGDFQGNIAPFAGEEPILLPAECDANPQDCIDGLEDEVEGMIAGLDPGCDFDFNPDIAGGDNRVDGFDLLTLLSQWGPCPEQADCPADFDNNGVVNVQDLLLLLLAWGPMDEYDSYTVACVSSRDRLELIGHPEEPENPASPILAYKQTANISLNGQFGQTYIPPNLESPYNGEGFRISGMNMSCKEGGHGLFMELSGDASVSNLTLYNFLYSNVKGSFGAVASIVHNVTGYPVKVSNVKVEAFRARGTGAIGGLVGTVSGPMEIHNVRVGTGNNFSSAIYNALNDGDLCDAHDAEFSYAGGLVGLIAEGGNVDITSSSVHMTELAILEGYRGISSTIDNSILGGLIGGIEPAGRYTIATSFSAALIDSAGIAGGLVGRHETGMQSFITNSYSTSTVLGESHAGGLVGARYPGPLSPGILYLMHSYSPGLVIANGAQGGLLGYDGVQGYPEHETVYMGAAWDETVNSHLRKNDQARSKPELQTLSTFGPDDLNWNAYGYKPWNIDNGVYPSLKSHDSNLQQCFLHNIESLDDIIYCLPVSD